MALQVLSLLLQGIPKTPKIRRELTHMRKQTGFSLIELLIVVSIILIIAAIAIPGLLKARISANQASAVESMRTILTAESSYQSTFGNYAPTILALGSAVPCPQGLPPTAAQFCFLDSNLSNATNAGTPKSGYFFTYVIAANNNSFTLNADPSAPGSTSNMLFSVS